MSTMTEPRTFSRRTFVKGAGALVVAIGAPRLLDPHAADAAINPVMPSLEVVEHEFPIGVGPAQIDPNQIDSWFAARMTGPLAGIRSAPTTSIR